MDSQDCNVCFDALQTIICQCKCGVCTQCQELSKSPKCVQCSIVLSSTVLGPKLSKSLLQPWEEDEFWKREESLLANTQELLDWEKEIQRLKTLQRYGLQPQLPPKPKLNLSTSDELFPCPSLQCRGFISKNECGTCKSEVCSKCREIHTGKCNPDTLASLIAILSDSRACPRCGVSIHKTLGCDHMFCTHCRTHWHWETRKILKESSNGHYNSTPIFANAPTLPFVNSSEDCAHRSLQQLFVHQNAMRTLWSQALAQALVNERKQIIFALQTLFDPAKIRRKHEESLITLRLKFLKGEKTKEKCKTAVWKAEKNLEKLLALSHVLYINLEQTFLLHAHWMNSGWTDTETIVNKFNSIQEFCTLHCKELKAMYGGETPSFHPLTLESRPIVDFFH